MTVALTEATKTSVLTKNKLDGVLACVFPTEYFNVAQNKCVKATVCDNAVISQEATAFSDRAHFEWIDDRVTTNIVARKQSGVS
eukprot:m.235234 g.235234  ORF g.235234 m.235234 type:complete len:84 (-) comp33664_c1_seq39:865-1116(-)